MPNEYQVHLAKSAEDDLISIVDYISNELMEPELALGKYEQIRHGIMTLGDAPKRIPLVRDEALAMQGYRIHLVENYHVFYVIDEERKRVHIVRILYARRDWQHLLRMGLS